jgi:hypothetical protein
MGRPVSIRIGRSVSLWTGGNVVVGPTIVVTDLDSLPEWDALRRALAADDRDVEIVEDKPALKPAAKADTAPAESEPESELESEPAPKPRTRRRRKASA